MFKSGRNQVVLLGVVAIISLLLVANPDAGAEERPKKMKDRVSLLEEQVDGMEEKLGKVVGSDAPQKIRERQEEIQDKLDKVSDQLEDMEEKQAESGESAAEMEARLDAAAEEIENLWAEIEALRQVVEEAATRKNAGYEDGFFIASDDGKTRLTINAFVRPYYQVAFQEQWDTDAYGRLQYDTTTGQPQGGDVEAVANGFGVANTRLDLQTQVLEVIHGRVSIDYGTINGEVEFPTNARMSNHARYNRVRVDEHTLRFLDAYGEWRPVQEFGVRLGQFKVPFDREFSFLANELTFTSRSLMTRSYARWGEAIPEDELNYNWDYEMQRASSFGWDRGLALSGDFADAVFGYAVGIFNGGGPNAANDNRDILTTIRLSTDPLGRMTPGMSDIDSSESPLLSIGAAFAYDLPLHGDRVDPHRTYNSQDVNVAGDAHFKWMGLSLMASVFYRLADHGAVYQDENGKDDPIDTFGAAAQVSYYINGVGLEPGFRYSMLDADIDRELDHVHEFSGILNYYIYGQNLKLQLEYRGLFPAQMDHAYLVPWETWYDNRHEITIMAQAGF